MHDTTCAHTARAQQRREGWDFTTSSRVRFDPRTITLTLGFRTRTEQRAVCRRENRIGSVAGVTSRPLLSLRLEPAVGFGQRRVLAMLDLRPAAVRLCAGFSSRAEHAVVPAPPPGSQGPRTRGHADGTGSMPSFGERSRDSDMAGPVNASSSPATSRKDPKVRTTQAGSKNAPSASRWLRARLGMTARPANARNARNGTASWCSMSRSPTSPSAS